MKEQIERALQPLIGASFWGAGRARFFQWHSDDDHFVLTGAGIR